MKRVWVAAAVMGLMAASLLGLAYGLWLNQIRLAERSFASGRHRQAEEQFRAAGSAWQLRVLPDPLVRENRADLLLNLAQIGYLMGKYPETLALLRNSASLPGVSDRAEFHFWVGNLLLRQSVGDSRTEVMETLSACRDEFLESMRRAPDFWDAKYNYEYVSLILRELSSGEDDREPDLKLLLERLRTDQQREKKALPPQKRG